MAKYKLDVKRDVDIDDDGPILNLPAGFRLDQQDVCHTMGFDTMAELRKYARTSVVPCDCAECKRIGAQA